MSDDATPTRHNECGQRKKEKQTKGMERGREGDLAGARVDGRNVEGNKQGITAEDNINPHTCETTMRLQRVDAQTPGAADACYTQARGGF
jgi:hypothetical protein